MPEDKELVPIQGELVPADVGESTEINRVFSELSEQIQKAMFGFVSQNVQEVETAARTANALYNQASTVYASPENLFLLGILKDLACLYAPLTRVTVFQIEGRFSKAFEHLAKAQESSSSTIAKIDEYAKLPDADQIAVTIYRSLFSLFPILFKGLEAYLRAEIVGYQGNIYQYTKLLVKAASEFRQAERLQPNVDPMFLMLVGVCTNFADRVETRAEVFGSMKGQRYLSPIGDKIFIIHGHDEAKWRELEKLLFNEFNLQTIVLKEERGAGETLIEKFEKFADACCYAFVMLTPDDFIKKEGKSYFQPRPNVLFELGWFYGRFGRDRVCMLKRADSEIPSDLAGILSIDFRDNVDEGFRKIRTELQKLGIIATQRLTRRSTGRAKKRPPVT